jgi:hypothetical protein
MSREDPAAKTLPRAHHWGPTVQVWNSRATIRTFGATTAQLLLLHHRGSNCLGALVLSSRGTCLADVSEKGGAETAPALKFVYILPRMPWCTIVWW